MPESVKSVSCFRLNMVGFFLFFLFVVFLQAIKDISLLGF